MQPIRLHILPQNLAVCKIPQSAPQPEIPDEPTFFCYTGTEDERSVVLPESLTREGWQCERGWRAFKVQGPLDFSLVGILAGLTGPLAKRKVSIFAVSTYDTDYILVKEKDLALARDTFVAHGHEVVDLAS